jgi:hypothetical protein
MRDTCSTLRKRNYKRHPGKPISKMASSTSTEEEHKHVNSTEEWFAITTEFIATCFFVYICCASVCVANHMAFGNALGTASLVAYIGLCRKG